MQCAADVDYVCDVIPASTENIQLHSKKKKIPNMNITKILLMTTRFFYMVRKWLNFCNIDGIHDTFTAKPIGEVLRHHLTNPLHD